MIRHLILDFDGTLGDTTMLILATMSETFRRLGLPQVSVEKCKASIGLRPYDTPAFLFPDRKDLDADEFVRVWRKVRVELRTKVSVKLYPGVLSTLDLLKERGIDMAVASSRSGESLNGYLESLGLTPYMSTVVSADDVEYGKPYPDAALKVMDRLGWQPSESMTVGDASVDIEMGHAAGTHTCAVTYGNGTLADLQNSSPDAIIDSFPRLADVLSNPSF